MKLTQLQYEILSCMADGSILVNGDESPRPWWFEKGANVHAAAAKRLAATNLVEFYRKEGGQPGVLFFRITETGRSLLNQEDKR